MHAIIGCGRVAINHVYAFNCWKKKIKICCDIDVMKAEKFATKYNIKHYTNNINEILEDDEIDTVSICTDHGSHYNLTMQALKHKKNVIVEKPIALKVEDAMEMVDFAKKNGLILMAISQHRYDKLINEINLLLNKDLFGNIAVINAFLQCSKDDEYYLGSGWRGTMVKEGGSSLINQAIHTLDLLIYFFDRPKCLFTKKKTIKFTNKIETEDTLVSLLEFKNGAIGAFTTTNCSIINWKSYIEIVGTNGSISFTTGHPIKLINFKLNVENEAEIKTKLQKIQDEIEPLPPSQSYYGISHKYQILDFLNAVYNNKRLRMLPEAAVKTLATVLDIYQGGKS